MVSVISVRSKRPVRKRTQDVINTVKAGLLLPLKTNIVKQTQPILLMTNVSMEILLKNTFVKTLLPAKRMLPCILYVKMAVPMELVIIMFAQVLLLATLRYVPAMMLV